MQARGLHATLLPPPRGTTRHSRRGRCGGMARLLRPHPRLRRHRRPARAESARAGLRDRRMRAERLAALRQGRRRLPQLLRKTMRTAPGGGELGGSQGRRHDGRHAEHRDDRRTRRTAHGQGGQRRRRLDQTPEDDRPTPAGGAPPLPLPEGLLQPDLPQRPRLSLRLLPRRVRRLLLRRRGQRPGGPTVLRRPRRGRTSDTRRPRRTRAHRGRRAHLHGVYPHGGGTAGRKATAQYCLLRPLSIRGTKAPRQRRRPRSTGPHAAQTTITPRRIPSCRHPQQLDGIAHLDRATG